jgi:hypothetical protein
MNREQTVVCHFSTTDGAVDSHIPQQIYPIRCGEDSGSGDVMARVNPLLKIFQEIQEIFLHPLGGGLKP